MPVREWLEGAARALAAFTPFGATLPTSEAVRASTSPSPSRFILVLSILQVRKLQVEGQLLASLCLKQTRFSARS